MGKLTPEEMLAAMSRGTHVKLSSQPKIDLPVDGIDLRPTGDAINSDPTEHYDAIDEKVDNGWRWPRDEKEQDLSGIRLPTPEFPVDQQILEMLKKISEQLKEFRRMYLGEAYKSNGGPG